MKDITKYFELKQNIKYLIDCISNLCNNYNKDYIYSCNEKDLLKKKENLENTIKLLKN